MNDIYLRRIPFERTFNFRTLGGYAAMDGKMTKYGVLYRCGWLSGLTDGDKQRIMALGVRTVIDLRGADEVSKMPGSFANDEDVELVHIDLLSDLDPREVYGVNFAAEDFLPKLYEKIVFDCGEKIKGFIETVARRISEGAVLFHCSAGKDRTGIMSMLLLGIAGVDKLDILADYQVSATYSSHMFSFAKAVTISPASHMEGIINTIEEKFGGIMPFVKHLGITDEQLDAIRVIFLEK